MQFAQCMCVLFIAAVLVSSVDARGRKTFSTRRKSGSNRRGQTSHQHKPPPPPPQPVTPHRTDSSTSFLNSERAGSSQVNTHHRGDPFKNVPQTPKQNVPQTNGPIGFEGLNNHGNQKLGFDKVNSEVQRKPAVSNTPSAPAYPAAPPAYSGSSSYPGGRPGAAAPAPNGPPPAYPGYGSLSGTHTGGFESPPAYPGRPVNAPPVYSANNPSFGQPHGNQPGFGGYPQQHGSYPGQSYPGQQNFGYPNSGGNFGNYPHQGSYQSGGFGQSYPGGYGGNSFGGSPFGGSPFGGSPFGQPNHFGGGSYGSSGFGGNFFGGNSHYSPNNFGYSSNPGFFGSHSSFPGQFNHGYHKKSRFGGLPIPIPIPIPLPMGLFGGGGWGGGRSHNHHVLDTFIQNRTVNNSDNTTTSIFIINNSTVTPCTTDQLIYDSLNMTVMSCTAGNCTAVKIFITTYLSKEASEYSAGITMCMEPNTTYNTFSNNVNPSVSDLHKYWMKVCREIIPANFTSNVTDQVVSNFTVKVTETVLNETVTSEGNSTGNITEVETTTPSLETSSASPIVESSTVSYPSSSEPPTASENITSSLNTSESFNASSLISTDCEIFDCSWIELCIPAIEIVDRCETPNCPFTKKSYRPCIKIKMCKSPLTPISTFATLNNTISRIDELNNVITVSDVANLTLISFIPPQIPANCSDDAKDSACQPILNLPQEGCAPSNTTQTSPGDTPSSKETSPCQPATTESVQRGKRSTNQVEVDIVNEQNQGRYGFEI